MAYLGNAPARSFISFERQVFTIVNSQTAYTLSHSVTNENDIRLVINNVVQEPGSGKAYTATGTTLTLSAALVNGTDEMYCVFLGRATATNAPGAGSVGASQLASDAVTAAKLNDDIISGQTALGATPADTDEFLVSDAGTIKRVDYSYLKSGDNTPMFLVSGGSGNQTISHASGTTITYNQEIIDTDNAFASNVFTVPSGKAGKYFFSASCQIEDTQADVTRFVLEIQKNDNSWRQIAFRFTSNQDLMQVSHTVTAIDDASVADEYKAKVYVETDDGGSVIIENNSTSYSNNWFQGFKLL